MDLTTNGICHYGAAVYVQIVQGSNIFQQIYKLNLWLRLARIREKIGASISTVACIVPDTKHLY
jgi:hypothetical protein